MDTLVVEKVEPYADGDESASVSLRSTRGIIEVFCYPCELKAGDLVANHLSVMDSNAQAAYLSDWSQEEKNKASKEWLEKTGPYSYRGCGYVKDQRQGIIEVLGFLIELDEVPCDGAVEFDVMRIDI